MGDDARSFVRWIGTASAIALVMCSLGVLTSEVAVPIFLNYASSIVGVTFATVATCGMAPKLPRAALVYVLVAVAALEIVATYHPDGHSEWAAFVVMVSLLLGGSTIGTVVGRAIQHAGQLFIVGVVFTLADTFSVFHPAGPSAVIVEAGPSLISFLALPWPVMGTGEFAPVLGVGDVVGAALFVGATRAHNLPVRRTLIALAVGLILTMLIVWWTELPIPALPLMSLAVLSVQPEARRLRTEDRKPALIGVLVLATLYGAAWIFSADSATP